MYKAQICLKICFITSCYHTAKLIHLPISSHYTLIIIQLPSNQDTVYWRNSQSEFRLLTQQPIRIQLTDVTANQNTDYWCNSQSEYSLLMQHPIRIQITDATANQNTVNWRNSQSEYRLLTQQPIRIQITDATANQNTFYRSLPRFKP